MVKLIAVMLLLGFALPSWSSNSAGRVGTSLGRLFLYPAEKTKKNRYFNSAVIKGGEFTQGLVRLGAIRRGLNSKGFERVVLDFDSGSTKARRASYFQVSIKPKIIVISLKGVDSMTLEADQLKEEFRKSRFVDSIEIFPAFKALEVDIQLRLRRALPVEVFELADPGRLVLDLKVVKGS